MAQLQPKVTSSGGSFDLAALTDGDLGQREPLAGRSGRWTSWIQFEFAHLRVFGIHPGMVGAGGRGFGRGAVRTGQVLQSSDDGRQFRDIVEVPLAGAAEHTLTFRPWTAKFFRVSFTTQAPPPATPGLVAQAPPTAYPIAELVLLTGARVNASKRRPLLQPRPTCTPSQRRRWLPGMPSARRMSST